MALKVKIVFVCAIATILFQVRAATDLEISGLQQMNNFRDTKNLSLLKLDDDLTNKAGRCAEYFGRVRKLGNCPYYDKGKAAYMAHYTSSTSQTLQEVLDQAFGSWKQRGTITTGLGSWFKKFGVGVKRGSAGTYVVVLMN